MSQRSLLVYLRWLPLYLRVNASDKNSVKIDQLESFPSFWWVPKGIAYFYVNIIDRIMNTFARLLEINLDYAKKPQKHSILF